MIDLHCHLDLYPNAQAVADECAKRRLYVLSMTTTPSAFEGTENLSRGNPRIRTALGLHPELASRRMAELTIFEKLLPRTRYVGEVGLDASAAHRDTLDSQREAFRQILWLSERVGGRVFSIHSRNAVPQVLDLLATHTRAGLFVLHWFLGSATEISRAAEMGCWFSVGPSMLASTRGTTAAAAMPKERVLPESDGPFGKCGDRAAFPWDAWNSAVMLADVWRTPEASAAALLHENFKRLAATSQSYSIHPAQP